MKTYVLIVSRAFPKTHARSGEPTYFRESIISELKGHELLCDCKWSGKYSELRKKTLDNGFSSSGEPCYVNDDRCPNCGNYAKEHSFKCHTIRANYHLWKKRIDEVNAGEAILSVRYWSGKPYNSKQLRIVEFDKDSGIGVQMLFFDKCSIDNALIADSSRTFVPPSEIAKNDGLSLEDFREWFRKYDLSKPMAIIQLTKFRY